MPGFCCIGFAIVIFFACYEIPKDAHIISCYLQCLFVLYLNRKVAIFAKFGQKMKNLDSH